MNIFGIGTDIVSIKRVEAIWQHYGIAFAERILTCEETAQLLNLKTPAAFLAKRFAVKEALAKALGTGFRGNILLTEMGVENDALGKPHLFWKGKTAEVFKQCHIQDSYMSVADEKEFAVAFVILVT